MGTPHLWQHPSRFAAIFGDQNLRAKTNITAMRDDLIEQVHILREAIPRLTHEELDALSQIETFCAVALRIIAKTNPSKVRSEAMTTEISYLMNRLPKAAE